MNKAQIHYYDIGDYLSREDKLNIIKRFGSIARIPWTIIAPNAHGDWINHRNEMFKKFIPIEPGKKFKKGEKSFFETYAIGVATNRDAWVYNFSAKAISDNMRRMINFYNEQKAAYTEAIKGNKDLQIDNILDNDTTKISWTVNLKKDIERNIIHQYQPNIIRHGAYRPFCRENLYYDKAFIERIGISPKLFPTPEHGNQVICVSCVSGNNGLSLSITNCIPDLHYIGDTQCFPLYWYEESKNTFASGGMDNIFTINDKTCSYERRDGITDWILSTARKQYGYKVTKEDIFYYVYGILHSPDYRTTFAADLKKSLPRLPLVEKVDDFWSFSKSGRELAELHLNYEAVEPYRKCQVIYAPLTTKDEDMNYRVEKMRFAKRDSKTLDKSIIHYNAGITIENIPAEAYGYVVNGKSAIEWIMERYAVTTDKKSGITNDPNNWAKEHEDEKYILNLLLRIINVSMQTVEIVKKLPKIKFEE